MRSLSERPVPLRRAALLIGLLLCAGVGAEPAAWYLWQSRLDGRSFCAQTAPGEGWQKLAGPFRDARCTRRA